MKTHPPQLSILAALGLAAAALLAACETYDPPPEATMVQPASGVWTPETPLAIDFTEPIDPASLVVDVWPSELDLEGNIRPEVQPLVSDCTLAASPCGAMTMTLDDSATHATIEQHDAFDSRLGKPLLLIVRAGLADAKGRKRKVETRFDFQVNPLCGNSPVGIDLDSGLVSMTANLQVLPVWLHMYLDFAIDKSNGKVVVVGSFARLNTDADGKQRAPNYDQPDGFKDELGPSGWAVTFTGCVVDQGAGQYFFESDPFDVHITVLNTIPVILTGFKVQGSFYDTHRASDPVGALAGRDFGAGTLSTSGGSFGDPPNTVDPITTAWDGFGFHSDEVPEGLPRTCDASPCAAMDAGGGDCQLPDPWDPGAVCGE